MKEEAEEAFDVFLSYSHFDAEEVEELAKRLVDEFGLRVWLDKWVLVAGKRWQQTIVRGLDIAKSCAVFFGNQTPKGWFRERIERAINRQTIDVSFRVIPVLLPNAQAINVDDFFKLTLVDFKNSMDDPKSLNILVSGVKGVSPGKRIIAGRKRIIVGGKGITSGGDVCIGDVSGQVAVGSYIENRLPTKEKEPVPVLLGVSAPKAVKTGDIFSARFVAYIKSMEEKVKQELSKLNRGRSESYVGMESCRWKLDTHVTVKLSGKHLKVDPSESEFVWKGERNLVNFLVEVLADAPEEWTVLRYEVFIDGIRVAFIPLDLEITSSIKSDKMNIATKEPAHTAFASYSSLDKMRVLDRVAAVRISAGLDIFMDCLSLHPGEEWKNRLESEIESRDLFLLFWSANAKKSEWVTWEWKTAQVKKGDSAIQLHPLQTASEAPPPEELKKFHFGDVYMIIRDAQEKKG